MNKKQHENMGVVLRYGAMSEDEQRGFVRTERDRIARILREAKEGVKANKAANGGVYEA